MQSKQTREQMPRVSAPIATLGLTFLFLLLFSALTGFMLYQTYNESVSRAETRALASAHVVSAHIQWLVEASYQALRRIDEAVGGSLQNPPADAIGDLTSAVENLPEDVQAWVFDANGRPRLTNAGSAQSVNAADRDYFLAAKAGADFNISPLIVSRSSGSKVFVVAKRLERQGQFVGVAIVVIPADVLSQFKDSLELGPLSTVGLFRDDGMLVTRYPVPDEALDLSKYVLFTDYLKKNSSGTYFAISPADGVERIVGYRRVEGTPLVAVASIGQSEAFGTFWETVQNILVVAIPGMVGLLLLSLWTARLLRRDDLSRLQLSKALEDNQTLFREIHHRVKNNLQQVAALVQLQPLPPEAKLEMGRRIAAMVAVHEHIYRSDQYARVDVSDYVPKLVQNLKESYGNDVDLVCEIAPIEVDRDHALPLGLIVNEVVSNAMKHAFKDGRKGRIILSLERKEGARGELTIRDNGVGFDPSQETTGMGSRLIRGLVSQLDAEHEFSSDGGTIFVLRFPILDVAAD